MNTNKKVIHSLKWNFIGMIGIQISKIIVTILLTRILNPEDFGLLAISMSILIIGSMFSDFGLGSALIQKNNIVEKDIRYVFTLQVLFGLFLSITLFSLSPIIGTYFDNSQIVQVLQALSFIFVIQSLSITSMSLLKKSLDFKKIQLIQLTSYFISYFIIGIPMALHSYGVWSLVSAQLSQVSLQVVFLFSAKGHSVKPIFFYKEGKNLLKFGSKSIINNLLSWVIDNINTLFIGHFLSIKSLGYFNRTMTLAKMPMDMITGSFQSVLFSFYAKIQNQEKYIKKIYLSSVGFISLLVFPLFFTVAAVPETIIGTIFGSKWLIHSNIMVPLALAMPLNTLLALAGPILWGHNKGEIEIKAQFYSVVFIVILLYFLSQHSIMFASVGVFIAFLIRLFFINNGLFSFIDISWKEFLIVLIKPLLLGSIISISIFIIDIYITLIFQNYILSFMVDIISASAILLFIIFTKINFFIGEDLKWLLEKNKISIPYFIRHQLWSENE